MFFDSIQLVVKNISNVTSLDTLGFDADVFLPKYPNLVCKRKIGGGSGCVSAIFSLWYINTLSEFLTYLKYCHVRIL